MLPYVMTIFPYGLRKLYGPLVVVELNFCVVLYMIFLVYIDPFFSDVTTEKVGPFNPVLLLDGLVDFYA